MRIRTRKTNNPTSRVVWSTGVRWQVVLTVDNRANITNVLSTCMYGSGEGITYGHAAEAIGPFDDVDLAIDRTMIDSAINCSDQLTLFDRP